MGWLLTFFCADAELSLDVDDEEDQGDVLAAAYQPPLSTAPPRDFSRRPPSHLGVTAGVPRPTGGVGGGLPGAGLPGAGLPGAILPGAGFPAASFPGFPGVGLPGDGLQGMHAMMGAQLNQLQQLQQVQLQQAELAHVRAQTAEREQAAAVQEAAKKRKRQGVDDLDEEEEVVPVVLSGVDGVEDDGATKICWAARSLPPYTGELAVYWRHQPMVVRPLRESYDASHLRMDPVNGTTTLRDHDRGAKRTIKQYSKANIRVSKTKAVITSSGQDTCDVGLMNNFAECTGVFSLVSALWQYTTNLFMIRRDDFSGIVMLRVLHDIKFFQPLLFSKTLTKAQRDSGQVQMCQFFINEAMEQNSMRGKQGRPPLVYEDLLKLARSATGVLYSGSGIGLGWDVGTDAIGLDPYSCTGSSAPPATVGVTGGAAGGAAGGSGGGGGTRRQRQQQSRFQAAAQVAAPAAAVAAAAASAKAGVASCRDWNSGRCTRPTCK